MKKKITKKIKKLLDKAEKAEEFPFCAGSFDDCARHKVDPQNPSEQCLKCPMYMESRYYQPARLELDDFARELFSKSVQTSRNAKKSA